MNWLHYLLEANLYLCVFYAGYCLFLNKETYYTLNRVYLLLSCIVSFIIPVVQIGWLKPAEQPLQTFIITGTSQLQIQADAATTTPQLTINELMVYAYILGVATLAVLLIVKIYQLLKLTKTSKTRIGDKYKLINVHGSNTAFSFFNYLFIGTKTAKNNIIIQHELVHIRQKHSVDIVFLELIKIINWFNPLVYLLQISLKTVHEYIADEQTAMQESDAISYSSFLVSNAYGLSGSSIAHSFFNYNLLKKRIIMLNQKRSGKLARLKYLVALPISCGLLGASTLAFSKTYGFIDLLPKHQVAANRMAMAHSPIADTTKRAQFNLKGNTPKGYKYEESGFVEGDKADFKVVIQDKNGERKEYLKSQATPEVLATLKEKYGYSFPKNFNFPKPPPPPPLPAGSGPHKITNQLPPPPPPPIPAKKGKKLKATVDMLPAPAAPGQEPATPLPPAPPSPATEVRIPPPPPPADPFHDLHRFIGRNVRYPSKARNARIAGQVMLSVNVTDGKINNVKLLKSIDTDIDNEILRVLNSFDGKLGVKSGMYNVPVAMELLDSKTDNQVPEKQAKEVAAANPSAVTINQSVVVGYL
ncbi:M56 family metallopeptidase [Mucilaginibacter celer]|uniref:TonB family protein n=1 Tax=Mucilaginibacter celer TaxID=2305508 RepID=A0A494VII3_9SPHI|nr:M56 family metallopeptidase [Mucilaginibacter celer]AYL94706.1 hypothetical protein HYN43_005075 [Mucilaginibacter celer]